jgi:hypothetical protein
MSSVSSSVSASSAGMIALQRSMQQLQQRTEQIAKGDGDQLDNLVGLTEIKQNADAAIKAIDVENRTLGKVVDLLA